MLLSGKDTAGSDVLPSIKDTKRNWLLFGRFFAILMCRVVQEFCPVLGRFSTFKEREMEDLR